MELFGNGFDESLLTAMIFIDLEKAYGKINHKVLLQKLKQSDFQYKVFSG